jgi:hypothetical protein
MGSEVSQRPGLGVDPEDDLIAIQSVSLASTIRRISCEDVFRVPAPAARGCLDRAKDIYESRSSQRSRTIGRTLPRGGATSDPQASHPVSKSAGRSLTILTAFSYGSLHVQAFKLALTRCLQQEMAQTGCLQWKQDNNLCQTLMIAEVHYDVVKQQCRAVELSACSETN